LSAITIIAYLHQIAAEKLNYINAIYGEFYLISYSCAIAIPAAAGPNGIGRWI
jgi:hypothetical protein